MQGPLTASAMGGLELGGPTERRWLKSQGYHVVVNRVGTAASVFDWTQIPPHLHPTEERRIITTTT